MIKLILHRLLTRSHSFSTDVQWSVYTMNGAWCMLGEMLSLKPQCCNNITLLPTHSRPPLTDPSWADSACPWLNFCSINRAAGPSFFGPPAMSCHVCHVAYAFGLWTHLRHWPASSPNPWLTYFRPVPLFHLLVLLTSPIYLSVLFTDSPPLINH